MYNVWLTRLSQLFYVLCNAKLALSRSSSRCTLSNS
uniref:Uncharacterized protein n=1 Tax=Anguilla anguilla TaxID=7936 RepID=A0A0E9S0K4_ANGAN